MTYPSHAHPNCVTVEVVQPAFNANIRVEEIAQNLNIVNIQGMQATDYGTMTQEDHVYKTPDMYVASDERVLRPAWLYNFETKRIVREYIDVPPAVCQLFMEIIANAVDNVGRSRRKNAPERPDQKSAVEITVDRQTVTVKNYGLPMPVVKHAEFKDHYIASLMFGTMLSSSNYKEGEDRHEGGRNGIGAKATNIFSKRFEVTIYDAINNLYFHQVWENNMKKTTPPEIRQLEPGVESSMTIAYTMDFERFGYQTEVGYPDEALKYFASVAAGSSFTTKTPISFNGIVFDCRTIFDYAYLIFGEAAESGVVHYILDDETEEVKKRCLSDRFNNGNSRKVPTPVLKKDAPEHVIVPKTEILLLDPTKVPPGIVVSFVNCLMTSEGGAHINSIQDAVIPAILNKINNKEPIATNPKAKGKQTRAMRRRAKKGKEINANNTKNNKKPAATIKPGDIRPSLSMIVACRVVNPKFTSQIKDKLSSPSLKVKFPPETIKPILSWGFMDRLKATLRAIELTSLSKTDGRKLKYVKMAKGFNANDAGGPNSQNCSLWIVEGNSAMAYGVTLISLIPNGRDTIGILPIRGKLLNVTNASPARIIENKEIQQLKKALGLREGTNYLDEGEFNTLRYGSLMIMADADPDGSHIKGLIMNFFNEFYPSLLQRGFIYDYRTKYLKGTYRGASVNFYTESEFDEWKKVTPDWGKWTLDYFKGLGTSEDKDVEEDRKNPNIVQLLQDQHASSHFSLAFGKTNSDQRKDWFDEWRQLMDKAYTLQNVTQVPITTFFNREFILYILESLKRAIPRMSDGLKRCQGQIVWGVMKKWNGTDRSKWQKQKVAQLGSHVATVVNYKHGEASLSLAIVCLARKFIGSNVSVNILEPLGQYGNRLEGLNSHAAPRYLFTKPSKHFYLIFRKEDTPILKYDTDDGKKADPIQFAPIFPYALLNTITGVATAYSSNFMSYNPIEVIDWLIMYISNKWYGTKHEFYDLVPWFYGFKGDIYLYRNQIPNLEEEDVDVVEDDFGIIAEDPEYARNMAVNTHLENDPEDPDADITEAIHVQEFTNHAAPRGKNKFDRLEVYGEFRVDEGGVITVSELPIGRWSLAYGDRLEEMKEDKIIKEYKDRSTKTDVKFEITGMKNPTHEKLHLIRRFTLSNMVMLDQLGIPVRFSIPEEYIMSFVEYRFEVYNERREYNLDQLRIKNQELSDRVRFITAILDGHIIVNRRPSKEVKARMVEFNINPKIYDHVKLHDQTLDGLEEANKKLNECVETLNKLTQTHSSRIWLNELEELRAEFVKDKDLIRRKAPFITYGPGKETVKVTGVYAGPEIINYAANPIVEVEIAPQQIMVV